MEQEDKKCTFEEHSEIKANIYCQECKIYMCNKCEIFHSKLLQNHHTCNLDKNINDIFTGTCKEKNHLNSLNYFCKNHNKLCCAACISKIKDEENGQHRKCNIYPIEEIVDEKKNILKDNIKYLENLSNIIEQNIKELKNKFNKINKDKEELKIKIQKIFTKIRNEINEREDKLLLEIDEYFNNSLFNEELIKQSEKLPKEININLEKGKLIEKEWKENKKLISIINDCIKIENNIKEINIIKEKVERNKEIELKIKFSPPEEIEINRFLYKTELFEKIYKLQIIKINNYKEKVMPNLIIIPPIIHKEIQPVIRKEIKPVIHPEIQPFIQPFIRKEIKPVIRKEIQPVIRKEIQPVIRKEIQPVIHPEIQPVIHPEIQPVIRKEIKPVIRKEIQPVIHKEIQPVIHKEIQPVIHKVFQPILYEEIQPVIHNEIQPNFNEQDQQIIHKEIQPIFEKKE